MSMKTMILLMALFMFGCAPGSGSPNDVTATSIYKAQYYYGLDSSTEFKFYKLYFYNSGKLQTVFGTLNKNTSSITIDSQSCSDYIVLASGLGEHVGLPTYADGTKPYQDFSDNTFYNFTYADGTKPFNISYTATKNNSSASYIESLNLSGVTACQ